MKKPLIFIIILSFFMQTAAPGYALRPMAAAISVKAQSKLIKAVEKIEPGDVAPIPVAAKGLPPASFSVRRLENIFSGRVVNRSEDRAMLVERLQGRNVYWQNFNDENRHRLLARIQSLPQIVDFLLNYLKILKPETEVLHISAYGSYLYGDDRIPAGDLDITVITKGRGAVRRHITVKENIGLPARPVRKIDLAVFGEDDILNAVDTEPAFAITYLYWRNVTIYGRDLAPMDESPKSLAALCSNILQKPFYYLYAQGPLEGKAEADRLRKTFSRIFLANLVLEKIDPSLRIDFRELFGIFYKISTRRIDRQMVRSIYQETADRLARVYKNLNTKGNRPEAAAVKSASTGGISRIAKQLWPDNESAPFQYEINGKSITVGYHHDYIIAGDYLFIDKEQWGLHREVLAPHKKNIIVCALNRSRLFGGGRVDFYYPAATLSGILLLQAYPEAISGKVVLDAGSGDGVLGILASRLGAKKVFCVERMREWIQESKALVQANGIDNISLLEGDIADIDSILDAQQIDTVVANLKENGLYKERGYFRDWHIDLSDKLRPEYYFLCGAMLDSSQIITRITDTMQSSGWDILEELSLPGSIRYKPVAYLMAKTASSPNSGPISFNAERKTTALIASAA